MSIDLSKVDYFGGCPDCGGNDGYLNIRKDHWFRCDKHKVRWYIGSNFFSSWQHEEQPTWEENARLLAEYRDIDKDVISSPLHTICDTCLESFVANIREAKHTGPMSVTCEHLGRKVDVGCVDGAIVSGEWQELKDKCACSCHDSLSDDFPDDIPL